MIHPLPASRTAVRLLGLLVLMSHVSAFGAEPAASGPKTHTLFMGSDISVVTAKGGSLPVRDVQNNAFVVQDGNARVVVTARDEQFRLKLDDTLKLTTASATMDKLTFERTYTAENDPMTKFKEAARASFYLSDSADEADRTLRNAQGLAGQANAGLAVAAQNPDPRAQTPWLALKGSADAAVGAAEAASNAAHAFNRMEVFNQVSSSSAMTSAYAAELFDALNVTFELSAPRPLNQPYVVVVMRYLADKERADTANVWVYAEKLPTIDETPRKFVIRRGGFPPGYHIDSYHVHLYEGGSEIATNIARKRVALTAADAFAYTVAEYVTANRGQTKLPAKARGFWPADLHSQLIPEKLTRLLFVKVGKNGSALGVFEDEACTRPIADEQLAALAPELRFLPALENGKPVPGVARVNLAGVN